MSCTIRIALKGGGDHVGFASTRFGIDQVAASFASRVCKRALFPNLLRRSQDLPGCMAPITVGPSFRVPTR